MKLGIYGGSFDPVHKGHIKVAKFAIQQLGLNKLFLVPTNVSPFKAKFKTTSNADKINMLNLVLEDKMEISEFETKRGGISYTIDTVKYFKKKYPNAQLFLIIGSDNVSKLHKWKEIDQIASLAQIVVIKRTKTINKQNIKKYHAILLNNDLFDYSSTEIKQGYLDMVDPKVLDYIQANGLYLEKIIHNSLSALRAKHSISTAKFAAELAKAHNISAKKAYFAGLMHDIAKEWSESESRNFIKEYLPELENVPKHELHQICGMLWAEHGYGIKDPEILKAIRFHTTMSLTMSDLDKIIFIADKICEGRRFPGIQKIRELVFQDLEQGFQEVVNLNYKQNIAKGVTFSKEALQIYDQYLKRG
ncbi:nicotinate-nucleotide adenylyltransferase [Mycoplasmopsis gallopavonis]|uniref:Probable nicotinate-nucleotide adenylyltransferase n=1 Tax=Mycoplasmopsis gallopavonis TaxID=76629 RepID=A0A449AZT3_9BACT|nr:nicotinate-nucleotide adenylyltransferase [Mycoplasmopsis gallopavonis]RIV16909.1 nicotinate-nucleotide adenylyltransferase [Mycoplasmopsis gallopavonis]VEU73011.1 nicotinate-nucleotide adenylyltransferase [Mycoplasmopsis gallopavonis]